MLLLESRYQESDQIGMSSLGRKQGCRGDTVGGLVALGPGGHSLPGPLLNFPPCGQAEGRARGPGQPVWSSTPLDTGMDELGGPRD